MCIFPTDPEVPFVVSDESVVVCYPFQVPKIKVINRLFKKEASGS